MKEDRQQEDKVGYIIRLSYKISARKRRAIKILFLNISTIDLVRWVRSA